MISPVNSQTRAVGGASVKTTAELLCTGCNTNRITEVYHNVFNNFVQRVIDFSAEVNASVHLGATEPTPVRHGKLLLCPALPNTNISSIMCYIKRDPSTTSERMTLQTLCVTSHGCVPLYALMCCSRSASAAPLLLSSKGECSAASFFSLLFVCFVFPQCYVQTEWAR